MIPWHMKEKLYFPFVIPFQTPPQSSQTTHSNDVSRVRIIRPHHPLFGQWVSVVRLWEHKKKRYYIIELPDKSHTRIPLYWADNGKFPLVSI
jgi:hypothetical protein